jgi:hypothetical protein
MYAAILTIVLVGQQDIQFKPLLYDYRITDY